MDSTPRDTRRAYSLAEVAKLFGKHRSWAYRQAREGRIRVIKGYGATLVPADEIKRILDDHSGILS